MVCSNVSLCGFQNGGAPLLYAVHGNHVRCVEILLGEHSSALTESSTAFINKGAGSMSAFQKVEPILPWSQILVSMQWTWPWQWVTGTVGIIKTHQSTHIKNTNRI